MSRAPSPDLPEQLNIADYFLSARLREGLGERVALRISGAGLDGSVDDTTWSYQQVQTAADRMSHELVARGVRREERVLIALRDGIDFVATFFGILQTGAVAVMLNPDLGCDEVAAQIDYTRAGLAVVGGDVAATFRAAMHQASWLENGLLIIGGEDVGGEDFGGEDVGGEDVDATEPQARSRETRINSASAAILNDANPAPFATVPTHRDEAAIWLYSGGTTGRPKAVVQSHRSFVNTTELYAKRTLGYRADDITLSIPKLYFGYATGSNLLFPFAVGGSSVLFPEPPKTEILFELIARHRPTILINVPTVVHRMSEHPDAAGQDLSCLRLATSAGEALPPALHERWHKRFSVPLLDGLGTAEMWHVFLTNRPGDIKPGTLGRVVEGFEIAVCDDDNHPVADGDIGRLWVRGDSRALGYWQNLDKTRDAFRGHWFVGGDLVQRDAEGYVTYCGRGDDAIKVGGRWLIPREVEDCLMAHPRVRECAVIGGNDEHGLAKPFAFVMIDKEAASNDDLEQNLKDHALERLAAYKHPRRVFVVDDLPRTHLGKVDRGALKRRLAAD